MNEKKHSFKTVTVYPGMRERVRTLQTLVRLTVFGKMMWEQRGGELNTPGRKMPRK